jgi:trehalose synthase
VLGAVPTTPKSLEDYRQIIGETPYEEIRALAADLRGARVVHVNATAFGGGVAEILATLVPLMNDVGLAAEWQVIKGADEFFNITKAMHNSLQGMYYDWTASAREIWLNYNRLNAELFDGEYDYVIIHDPQPAAMLSYLEEQRGSRHGRWIWRCHIDLTDAQLQVWDLLRPHVEKYDGAIFTLPDFVKDDLAGPEVFCIPPAIDPLSPKNVDLPADAVHDILVRYGIDPERPMIAQISRFDPWKDPLGVIDVYRQLKEETPGLQLVLVASMASDDPEGQAWHEKTLRRAGEDYDIHILSNLNGVGNVEVNAFQRSARCVIQKSLREGFGLVVSEALWKGVPVVAGRVGGIPLQIVDGETGYLVSTTEECVEKVRLLLRHPEDARLMGAVGAEHVREHFLTTRYLRDYLNIFRRLAGLSGEIPAAQQAQQVRR